VVSVDVELEREWRQGGGHGVETATRAVDNSTEWVTEAGARTVGVVVRRK